MALTIKDYQLLLNKKIKDSFNVLNQNPSLYTLGAKLNCGSSIYEKFGVKHIVTDPPPGKYSAVYYIPELEGTVHYGPVILIGRHEVDESIFYTVNDQNGDILDFDTIDGMMNYVFQILPEEQIWPCLAWNTDNEPERIPEIEWLHSSLRAGFIRGIKYQQYFADIIYCEATDNI